MFCGTNSGESERKIAHQAILLFMVTKNGDLAFCYDVRVGTRYVPSALQQVSERTLCRHSVLTPLSVRIVRASVVAHSIVQTPMTQMLAYHWAPPVVSVVPVDGSSTVCIPGKDTLYANMLLLLSSSVAASARARVSRIRRKSCRNYEPNTP